LRLTRNCWSTVVAVPPPAGAPGKPGSTAAYCAGADEDTIAPVTFLPLPSSCGTQTASCPFLFPPPAPSVESKTCYVRTLAQVHKTDHKSAGSTLAVRNRTINTTRR
ncbi:unnamed protein product, partial [Ectocarpus sp. 13 AM-2016]